MKALGEYYGAFLPASLNSCATCHQGVNRGATTLADLPHNPFGTRLRLLGEELKAKNARADIAARLRAIAAEDADGDRAPNETELLAGRKPGDSRDRPTAADTARVTRLRPKFLAFQNAYRWRPFEPVRRPAVPKVKTAVRSPIDAFLAKEREARGLKPRPGASRETLLRRVYLDLTGLSPSPEEQRAFLADRSPNAWEKVVDRLLASPQYGERWGRHWMDVWRYSDWAGWGEQVRDSQPHIWRWRDWIVESLNADKPYDRMVQEMLAGDELAPGDPKVLPATGYLVRNFKLLSREKWMEDVVDHTGQAFLGLTIGCARCHDHMYDPVSQKEYYRLRAIFEPHHVRIDPVPSELDPKKDGLPRAFDQKPDAQTFFYVRGDERQPVKDDPLTPGVPESLGGSLQIQPVKLPLLARCPEKQPFVIAKLREQAAERVEAARKSVQACASEADAELPKAKLEQAEAAQAALEAVLAVEALEDAGKKDSEEWKKAAEETVRAQRRLAAADAAVKCLGAAEGLKKAQAAMPPKPDELKKAQGAVAAAQAELEKAQAALREPVNTAYKPRVTSNPPAESTGRRLAFARWITARENPLAARVAVNQIWLRHFGAALVPSVADFGRNGAPPTHPQLLDWLAAEFMGRGWSMKAIHRLILTSDAYRMASTPDPAALAKDPDNRWYWRMNSRRMDAEIVRDNILHVAGRLDTKRGGPDIDQNLGLTVLRRSLYFRHAAEKEMVFTTLFDGPSVTECYQRKETVIPQQALALANSEIALVQSRLLAGALAEKHSDPAAFVTSAFERILARRPTAPELADCLTFLREQPQRFSKVAQTASPSSDGRQPAADPAQRARENLVLVLINHNDFVTIR